MMDSMLRKIPLLAALLVLTGAMTACVEDDNRFFDDNEESIRFMHDLEGTDRIEIYGDGFLMATLLPGQLSEAIGVDEDDVQIRVVDQRTARELVARNIVLTEQGLHIVALTAESASDPVDMIVVDTPSPVLGPNDAAVEVLNLLDTGVEVDVYINDERIASRPPTGTVIGFTIVDGLSNPIRVFEAGANPATDPPLATLTMPVASSSANLFILTDEVLTGAEPRLSITSVPLQ